MVIFYPFSLGLQILQLQTYHKNANTLCGYIIQYTFLGFLNFKLERNSSN